MSLDSPERVTEAPSVLHNRHFENFVQLALNMGGVATQEHGAVLCFKQEREMPERVAGGAQQPDAPVSEQIQRLVEDAPPLFRRNGPDVLMLPEEYRVVAARIH